MQSTKSLLSSLQRDFPEIIFTPGNEFLWSAAQKTIFFDPDTPNSSTYILHELSHALLEHQGYERDIELIQLERDAWEHARNVLSRRYKTTMEEEIIQDNLDTYRLWLHTRSTCPECEANGLQTKSRVYRCITCGHTWRVNEARLCALRRYPLQTK